MVQITIVITSTCILHMHRQITCGRGRRKGVVRGHQLRLRGVGKGIGQQGKDDMLKYIKFGSRDFSLYYCTTRSFETEMKHDIKALGQSCWPPQLPARCPLLSSCRRARAVCQLAAVAPASCPATWLPLTLLLPWASLANCWSCPTTSQPPSPT